MSVPTVLITGCAGYIGSVLTGELLSAGMKVIGIDNFMHRNHTAVVPHLGHRSFEFHRLDAANFDAHLQLLQRADVLIPLAALVGAPLCDSKPEDAKLVNQVIVQWMARVASPAQRIIYPNTNSGYGSTDGQHFCTEEDPMNPISVYGVTKCEAEKAVLDHPKGVALRLATVFGASPRMRLDLMVNDFTVKLCDIKKKREVCYSQDAKYENPYLHLSIFEPHFKRNFVHVRDVARAFRFAIGRPTMRGAYNLGLPDANLTKWELARFICNHINLTTKAVVVGDGRDPDQRNYLVSNDKIQKAGFTFAHGLKEGISEVETIYDLFDLAERQRMRNI